MLSTLTGPGRKWVVFGQILEPLSSILVNSPELTQAGHLTAASKTKIAVFATPPISANKFK